MQVLGVKKETAPASAEVGPRAWGLQPFGHWQLQLHLIWVNQQFLSQIKRKFHMSRDFCGPGGSTPLENSLQKLADTTLAQCEDPPLVNDFIT